MDILNDGYGKLFKKKSKGDVMRLNIMSIPYCAACKFWDDVGRSAMSPTFDSRIWNVRENEKRMCLKRHVITKAIGTCPKYESKMDGLLK